MSRLYSMSVVVGLKPEDTLEVMEKIKDALCEIWPQFGENLEDYPSLVSGSDEEMPALHGYGDDNLYGGMTEEEFTDQLAEAVWKAAGGYRLIDVGCICLEYLPVDHHCPDEEAYERIIGVKA